MKIVLIYVLDDEECFMKFFAKLLPIALSLIIATPVFAQDRIDSKVRFNDLYGEVSIRPNDDEDDAYEYAELDTIIYENDRIRTKEDSGAILGLEDMSTFVLKPESILVIYSKEANVTKMEMLAGRIWGNIKKMSEGESFGFEMTQCVAGIKGTIVGLSQSRDGFINKIYVVNGSLEVYSKPTNTTHLISAGQSLTIDGKQKKTEIVSFSIEEMKAEFMNDLKLRDRLLDESGLKDKINKYIDDINGSNSNFENRFLELKSEPLNSDTAEKLDVLRLESNRYKGALYEAGAVMEVAIEKNNNQQNILKILIENLTKKVAVCSNNIEAINKYTADYRKKINMQTGKVYTDEESDSKIAAIDVKIDVVLSEAKEFVDRTEDGSAYSEFIEARKACERYLTDLEKLSTELLESSASSNATSNIRNSASPGSVGNAKPFGGVINTGSHGVSNLASVDKSTATSRDVSKSTSLAVSTSKNLVMQKNEMAYKYIQNAMKKFSSVPEISADMIKNMKDLEKEISDSVGAVDKGLKEYNAISRTQSVDAKRKYVSAMTRLLASYGRATRYFNKSQRIAEQVQRNFNPSTFKSAEYYEITEYWQRAQDSMHSLGVAATQLKSCLEDIKNQLERALGG